MKTSYYDTPESRRELDDLTEQIGFKSRSETVRYAVHRAWLTLIKNPTP